MKFTNTIIAIVVLLIASSSMMAQQQMSAVRSVTLYSQLQYKTPQVEACIRLQPETQKRPTCDVRYGGLRVGDDWDWLESSSVRDSRSVIRDLGAYEWASAPKIPWVEPFPRLKPGEQRTVFVGSTGAAGKDGLPGMEGRQGADGDGIVRTDPQEKISPPAPTSRKTDSKPKVNVSSNLVKAIVGHMYVIHVVDETRDFYVLFRIDKITRGDNCTISWQTVPAPVQ